MEIVRVLEFFYRRGLRVINCLERRLYMMMKDAIWKYISFFWFVWCKLINVVLVRIGNIK